MRPKKIVSKKSKLSEELQNHVQKGRWDQAISVLDQLGRMEPANATFPLRKGDCFLKLGWKEKAVESYGEAAQTFAETGFIVKALAAYKMILRQDPAHAETLKQMQALHARSQAQAAVAAPPAPSESVSVPSPGEPPGGITEPIPIPPSLESMQPPPAPGPGLVDSVRSLVETDPELLDEAFLGVTNVNYDAYLSSGSHSPGSGSAPVTEGSPEFELEPIGHFLFDQETPAPPTASDVVPLFAGLSPEAFNEFTRCMIPLQYPPGATVIKEGDAGDSVFIISRGTVKIVTRLKGREIELGLLRENDFFGEVAFLTGRPRTASVITAGPTEVLELQGEDLQKIVKRFPAVKDVLKNFHQARVRATIEKVRNDRAVI